MHVCHLFGCSRCSSPATVFHYETRDLYGEGIYTVKQNWLTASIVITDFKTKSQDYSLVLMLDSQATHSFVYYAASIDFVGEYLQSLHSNDESFFTITALTNNTVIRIAPSKTVYLGDIGVLNDIIFRKTPHYQTANISDVKISYGEEYKIALDLGETIMVSNDEDLTGFKITANKAILPVIIVHLGKVQTALSCLNKCFHTIHGETALFYTLTFLASEETCSR